MHILNPLILDNLKLIAGPSGIVSLYVFLNRSIESR